MSHRMSRLLRHVLGSKGLYLDENCFVQVDNFLYVLNHEGTEWRPIAEDEVIYVINSSGASRFTILFDKNYHKVPRRVRAYQGHLGSGAYS